MMVTEKEKIAAYIYNFRTVLCVCFYGTCSLKQPKSVVVSCWINVPVTCKMGPRVGSAEKAMLAATLR